MYGGFKRIIGIILCLSLATSPVLGTAASAVIETIYENTSRTTVAKGWSMNIKRN